jgi:hypothetical protein
MRSLFPLVIRLSGVGKRIPPDLPPPRVMCSCNVVYPDVKSAQSQCHLHHHRYHRQKTTHLPLTLPLLLILKTLFRALRLKTRLNLDLEPNLFEQSSAPTVPPTNRLSASSPIRKKLTVSVSSQPKSDSRVTSGLPRAPSSSLGRTRDGGPLTTQTHLLSDQILLTLSNQYQWGLSLSSMANSLIFVPLSAAMLCRSAATERRRPTRICLIQLPGWSNSTHTCVLILFLMWCACLHRVRRSLQYP